MSVTDGRTAQAAAKLMSLLDDGGYTCVLSNGSNTVTSTERGVLPMIRSIRSGADYRGYAAADKVVGKAAALLYAYMGVAELSAHVISERAVEVCARFGIAVRYESVVPRIINRKGDGDCPMEQAVKDVDNPSAAVEVVTEKLKAMGLL